MSDEVKHFLCDNDIYLESQSGFRSGYSTLTEDVLVTNDIIKYLDNKQHCSSICWFKRSIL